MKLTASILSIFFLNSISLAQTVIPNGATSSQSTKSVVGVPAAYSSSNINYVRTWQPYKRIPVSSNVSSSSPMTDVQQETQYIDGIGRPLQNVIKAATPQLKDVVTPIVYDQYGRESYKYLPYVSPGSDGSFKLNPFGEQQTFMQSQYSSQGETFYYGKTDYEASPLNRTTKSMAAGNSWSGSSRGTDLQYWQNTAADSVKIWNVTNVANSLGTYAIAGGYSAGQLSKNITVDEHGKQVIEFKDNEGKVILKKNQLTASDNGTGSGYTGWLCTYYIYDELKNLRCVIQPRGVEILSQNSWVIDYSPSGLGAEQCFRYEYDSRQRMITKKVPGADEVYMLYDKRDRLVYTQDGNMRTKSWWMTNLYDGISRPVATGITIATKQQLQDYLNDAAFSFTVVNRSIQGSIPIVDMGINSREVGRTSYQASNSITFNAGFETETSANLIAEIVTTGTTTPSNIQIVGNPIPSGFTFTALTETFYDNYGFTSKTFDNSDNGKLTTGSNNFPETLPTSAAQQLNNIATGGRVWTLEDPNNLSNGRWLETANFYDVKLRLIQTQSENYKGGLEKLSNMYDFTGKVICNYAVHNNPAGFEGIVRIKTNMDFDKTGRLLTVTKQLNDNTATNKIIIQNVYDELGQLKTKKLGTDPNNTSQPLQTLNYEYNIRGWMKAVNKDYVNNVSNTNYFGQSLSYDFGFSATQFNGNIAGLQWRSKGDGQQRAYGFGYDAVNRLLKADFTQNNGGWNTSAGVNFSDSNLTYDANGNILSMYQKGLKLNTSPFIDKLIYTYQTNSNKLKSVTDAANDNTSKLGDFKYDSTTKTTTDYTYDVNGNMNLDNNKKISSIVYNHLNLPQVITVTGKGTITYTYDAAGNKLQKKTVDNTITPARTTTTSYISGFVYQNDTLQFTGHEEGRIRYKAVTNSFVYDYFLKDHLGNTRVVLTEEQQTDAYPVASLETTPLPTERIYYSGVDTGRVNKSTVPGYPSDTYTNPNDYIQKLNGSGNKIGTGIILKVMAGDKFNLRANSWYKLNGVTPGTPLSPLTAILSALTSGVANTSGGKTTQTELSSSGVFTPGATSFLTNESSGYTTVKPKAYVNWILFDEQFQYVISNSGFEQVGADQVFTSHVRNSMPVDKNGYLYIYVSNETPNIDVFFDNLQVTQIRGPLLEETHYYPFGLTMAGVSSKAAGEIENKEKTFQGQRFDDDLGLNWIQFKWRNHAPQIGRFIEIDPLCDVYAFNSTYAFSENKVTGHIELEGLEAYAAYNKHTGLLAIIPDVSKINAELDYKYVSAAQYNKLSNDERRKHNYGILIKNVFTGGHYDLYQNKIVHNDPNRPKELPISKGEYNIIENKGNTNPDRHSFFVLDPVDQSPYDKIDDRPGQINSEGKKRSGYNLHPGLASWGCVTICSQDPNMTQEQRKEEWDIINKVIESTKIENVPDNRGMHKYIPFATQRKYGTLKVFE
jgi:RHS repeat-associated protein